MTDNLIKVTVGELRKIISEVIQEAPVSYNGKPKSKSKKDPTEQRAVIDKVKEAISNAITENVEGRVRQALGGIITFSDLEVISEPPKTLIRLKGVDGQAGQDTIYLINVTKIV